MPTSDKKKKTESTPSLSYYLYRGLPFSHNAVQLNNGRGESQFYSFNADTQDENRRLEDDRGYTPKNELPLLDEDDSATMVYRFVKRQLGPMISHQAAIVCDSKTFGVSLPDNEVRVPVTQAELSRAKRWLNEQQQAVNQGKVRYSIFHRQDESSTHHSCASFADSLLAEVASDNEMQLLESTPLESVTTAIPTAVHNRAARLAKARCGESERQSSTPSDESAEHNGFEVASLFSNFG